MKSEIRELMKSTYGIETNGITPIQTGVGGDTYHIDASSGAYILKFIARDSMNHPELEPMICAQLARDHIPVPIYRPSVHGEYVIPYQDKQVFHLQTCIQGTHYPVHSAPDWLLHESSILLAKIHKCLNQLSDLPTGIGKEFFTYMTPTTAVTSYKNTLAMAKEQGNQAIVDALEFRLHLLEHFPMLKFDLSQLTICNTHGDYTINQLVCGERQINGVVDWTSACRHPAIWELMRSFVYAEPSSKEGYLDETKLVNYMKAYRSIYPLNEYDISQLVDLYYFQIAVCDYYQQYYSTNVRNRDEFLWQAEFATRMLRFLSQNREKLNEYLKIHML